MHIFSLSVELLAGQLLIVCTVHELKSTWSGRFLYSQLHYPNISCLCIFRVVARQQLMYLASRHCC